MFTIGQNYQETNIFVTLYFPIRYAYDFQGLGLMEYRFKAEKDKGLWGKGHCDAR